MAATDGLGLTPTQRAFYGIPVAQERTPPIRRPFTPPVRVTPRPVAPPTATNPDLAAYTFTQAPPVTTAPRTEHPTHQQAHSGARSHLTKKEAKRILADMRATLDGKDDPSGLCERMRNLSIERAPPRHGEAARLPTFQEEPKGLFGRALDKARSLFGAETPQEETRVPKYPTAHAGVVTSIQRLKRMEFNPETIKRDREIYMALSDFANSTISQHLYDAGDAANDYRTAFKPQFGKGRDQRAIAQEQLFQDMYKDAFMRIRNFQLPANIY
ncbi:MAG: hypothetical protein S4CHLAM37_06640 [Chlamydiia bacterium]|nr:hypothetical protein [Chlamydiia bacterium]